MRILLLLKDRAALKAAVEKRVLAVAGKVLALGHKQNPSGNNMSQR